MRCKAPVEGRMGRNDRSSGLSLTKLSKSARIKMILLEDSNSLISTLLQERVGQEKPSNVDQLFVDFDGVAYHLSSPEKGKRSVIVLSMCMRQSCWTELVSYGAMECLRREYGQHLQADVEGNTLRSDGTVFGWDVSLKFDMGPEDVGSMDAGGQQEFIKKVAMIKRYAYLIMKKRAALTWLQMCWYRYALGAPFERAFTLQKQLEAAGPKSSEDGAGKPSEHLMAVHYRYVYIHTATALKCYVD